MDSRAIACRGIIQAWRSVGGRCGSWQRAILALLVATVAAPRPGPADRAGSSVQTLTKIVERAGTAMAFPSQTVYVAGQGTAAPDENSLFAGESR